MEGMGALLLFKLFLFVRNFVVHLCGCISSSHPASCIFTSYAQGWGHCACTASYPSPDWCSALGCFVSLVPQGGCSIVTRCPWGWSASSQETGWFSPSGLCPHCLFGSCHLQDINLFTRSHDLPLPNTTPPTLYILPDLFLFAKPALLSVF